MIRVGFESRNYGGERNTYAPVPGIEHVKLRRVPFERAPGPEHLGLHRVFAPLPQIGPPVDLVHLWNRVSVGRVPWGVSFEDTLPYLNPAIHARMIRVQRARLLNERCRFVIGMSQHAVSRLRSTLTSEEWDVIGPKTSQIYPHHPVSERATAYRSPSEGESLRLMFVGGDFFRKGGESLLRMVERCGDELDLHLTVVSRASGNDYRGTPPAEVDVAQIQQRLASNRRIMWHRSLPHADVLALAESQHLGCLPTLSDTFGYSVIEFMSLGVPVLVSDVQALPEFTGQDTGWQLPVAKDAQGVWVGRASDMDVRRTSYFEAIELLTDGAEQALRQAREAPGLLVERSAGARSRFAAQFDPVARSRTLLRLYERAMQNDGA